MSELEEYGAVVAKLLDRTKNQKIHWNVEASKPFGTPIGAPMRYSPGFEATLQESPKNAFQFRLFTSGISDDRVIFLRAHDSQNHEIINLKSTSLPVDTAEENLSASLEELYEAARRQALKIPEKLKIVSDLLDRA